MKFEIWIQCVQPDWDEWSKLGSVKLKEAIYLSMDISPSWYEGAILGAVENYFDESEYRRPATDKDIKEIKQLYEEIEQEYAERLKISKSWFFQQDWAIGSSVSSPEDIHGNTYVDLMKFIRSAFMTMKFENECDFITNSMKGMEDLTDSAKIRPTTLSSMDWQSRAKLYAKEYLKGDQKLSLAQLADLISARFLEEKILSAHAGGKEISPSTIKDSLSKGGWFSQNQ